MRFNLDVREERAKRAHATPPAVERPTVVSDVEIRRLAKCVAVSLIESLKVALHEREAALLEGSERKIARVGERCRLFGRLGSKTCCFDLLQSRQSEPKRSYHTGRLDAGE